MGKEKILGGFFGACVGDAVGLPVQFETRGEILKNPVFDMQGYGVFNKPIGTWSDDSSLTFCLAESLCNGYDINDIGDRFVKWFRDGYWTPFGESFDVGKTTALAIKSLMAGISAKESGLNDSYSNGNGSLMRILPLAFFLKDEKDKSEMFKKIHEVSNITHAHVRSCIACSIYIVMVINLLKGIDKKEAYKKMKEVILDFYKGNAELENFKRVLKNDVAKLSLDKINSGGYVVDTLEASLWCFLNTDNYKESVLKAVNLGLDTDTTAAVTGGLAGIYYGFESIPEEWVVKIIRNKDIFDLAKRFSKSLSDKKVK